MTAKRCLFHCHCTNQLVWLSLLQILNNYLQFEVSHGPSDVESVMLSRLRVTDGEWHHLLIELKNVKEDSEMKHLVTMTLDYGMDQVSWYLHLLWGWTLWPREKQNDPLMCQDPPETLWIWGGTFWAPASGLLKMPRSLASSSPPLPRCPAPGSQQLTSSSCISQHDAVGAFSSGFF